MNLINLQIIFTIFVMSSEIINSQLLRGDLEEILPDDARRLEPRLPNIQSRPETTAHFIAQSFGLATPSINYKTKGDTGDLTVQESRHKNRRQSYNRRSKPQYTEYNTQNQHSNGKKSDGKGGYNQSGSYKGKKGYSSYDSYDRASKDKYADSDHKKYGNQGGNQYGHGKGGGGGKHHSSYSDNADDYL